MIKELFLMNFRGIKSGRLEDFSRFNILLGPNNSGKSTILEALYLLFSTTPADIYHEGSSISGLIPDEDFCGYDPLLRLQDKHGISEWQQNPAIFDEGNIKVKTRNWAIEVYRPDKAFEKDDVEKTGYFSVDYTRENLTSDKQRTEMEYLEKVVEEKKIERNFPKKGRVGVLWVQDFTYEALGTSVWAAGFDSQTVNQVLYFDVFTAMQHMKTAFYRDVFLSRPGWLDEIKERFGNIFPNGDFQVNFLPVENGLVRGSLAYRGKPGIPVDLLGDGARSIFKFLSFLTALDEHGLVLWEDPELFQHSETLERSIREVVDIAKQKELQIFFCTQSLEVIGKFAELLKEKKLSSREVSAYYLDLKDGILGYRPFTGENLLGWIEMELDPRRKRELRGELVYRMREEE